MATGFSGTIHSPKKSMETKYTAIGNIYALSSRIILLACGFFIHIFLARSLGPELYGLYGLIMSILIWVELSVLVGIPSTYKKAVSENTDLIPSVFYSIKFLFIPYCLGILLVFSLVSPLLSQLLHDQRLLFLLILAGCDIPFYGMYAAANSILNGYRAFFKESLSNSLYPIFKLIFVLVLVELGFKLPGALVGNILASMAGVFVAFSLVKSLPYTSDDKAIRNLHAHIFRFGGPYLLYMLMRMLLINIDLWFVKGLLPDDRMIGYYTVSCNLSRPLLFLITGIMAVTFPAFSKAFLEGNRNLLQKYIKQSMRFTLISLLPFVTIIGTSSDELITLLYTSTYLPASPALKILLLGISLFSVFSVFLNFIAAANRPFHSFLITLSLLPLAIGLNYVCIPLYGIEGAAAATTLISGGGIIISGIYLWKNFGTLVNFKTLSRVLIANGSLYFISKYITTSGYALIMEYILCAVLYIGLLLIFREFNQGDFRIIRETVANVI